MTNHTPIVLLNIGRAIILLTTLLYASKLDIKDRKVPHKTWIIPILLGCKLILLQTVPNIPNQTLEILYATVGVIITISILIIIKKLYEKKSIRQEIWAIPIVSTVTLLIVHLTIFQTTQQMNTLLLTIILNITFAIILGLFLHLFPNIGMGGADFVALVTIGFLLPTHPDFGSIPYMLAPTVPFPNAIITLPIMNVITNMALLTLLYLPLLPLKNIIVGETENPFLTAFTVEVPIEDLHKKHGRVIPTWKFNDASTSERFKLYFGGLDTFFLTDYFEWRQTVASQKPDSFADENDIFLRQFLDNHRSLFDYDEDEGWDTNTFDEDEEFMQQLLKQDTVRLMPGIPFIVPLTIGVITLFIIGDLLFIGLLALNGLLV